MKSTLGGVKRPSFPSSRDSARWLVAVRLLHLFWFVLWFVTHAYTHSKKKKTEQKNGTKIKDGDGDKKPSSNREKREEPKNRKTCAGRVE